MMNSKHSNRFVSSGRLLSCLIAGTVLVLRASADTNSPSTFRYHGTIVDSGGQPITGATLETCSFPTSAIFNEEEMEPKQLVVATNGTFDVQLPRQGAIILAHKPGLATVWRQFWNATDDKEERLTLSPPAALAGVVVDEADKPVANAEVFVAVANLEIEQAGGGRAFGYLTGKPARDCFKARTSADGRFRIADFPANASASLAVRARGKALRSSGQEGFSPGGLPFQAGQDDVRLVVEPAGAMEGKIVSDPEGQALPVAELTLQPDGPGIFSSANGEAARSRPDGSFLISEVAAGNYRVRAAFGTNAVPEWVAETVPVSVEAGQTNRGVQVTATHGGVLEVAVLGKKDRSPVGDASISAYRVGYIASAKAGSDGKALLRLPPGDYQVVAQKENTRVNTASATAELGKTNRVELELPTPTKLAGVVRRPDGQPAAGVEVRLIGGYGGREASPKTDASGKFEIPFSPQPFGGSERAYCLLVRDPANNLAVAEDIDEETGLLDLRLAPGMTLVGRAECAGKPLTNATAALVFWTGNSGMHIQGLAVGTNTPGRFEIPALPPGRKYGLYVSAPGYGQKFVNTIESSEESKRVELDPVELKPANFKLAGQVVDADDKPVAGAYVNLNGEGQPNGNSRTDREGRFSFNHVCEGSVQLSANVRNSQGSTSAEAGDTNVVLKLGEMTRNYNGGATARKLKGIVTGPDGKPVAGVQVAVFPFPSSKARTATNGAFSLNWSIQPWQSESGGEPCLVVRDIARNLAAAEDISEDTTNFDVRLQPAWTVTGRVEGVSGAPLTNAQVGVWLLAGRTYNQLEEQPAKTDARGNFALKALPPGPKYIIYASAKGHGRVQQELDADTATNRVELPAFVLRVADKLIAGQVVNAQDKPVSGVNVSLSGDGQPETYATTDSKGHFSVKVCDGEIRLFASGQNGYANTSVEAGDTNIVLELSTSGMSGMRASPKRFSLIGKPLPDLAAFGLPANAAPEGRPLLLCLLDADQRPSRRIARLLADQCPSLSQQGVTVLAIQAVPTSAETLQTWTNSTPMPFALGCVANKNAATRWATDVESLPWFILRDAGGRVTAEGFSLEELDAKLAAVKKAAK